MKLLYIKIWSCLLLCLLDGTKSYALDSTDAPRRPDYGSVAVKAQRFFKYGEWPNAAAMYELMLEERPKVCDTYAHAIVTAGMRSMPDYEIALAEKAQANLVPLDSLLQGVRRVSFSLGQTSRYEHFLLLLKERQPWLGRSIDKQLLRYYLFRRNGPGIIRYSRKDCCSPATTTKPWLPTKPSSTSIPTTTPPCSISATTTGTRGHRKRLYAICNAPRS